MSTTATLALKACPFCGDTDTRVFGESAPEWWVTCMGCRASSPCRTTRPQAIAGWNRRAALAQRTEQRTDPWRQAVDEALIAHALDCTGPGDDPKEKVKELIEWAVTIATDPRVAEQAGAAEPKGWKDLFWQVALALNCLPSSYIDGNEHVLRSARGEQGVLINLLRECVGPLEVSAAIFESEDAEPLDDLIERVKALLTAIDGRAALAADKKENGRG